MPKILVLGVGNIIRRDDGIGPRVIEKLKKQGQLNVDPVDGGTDGLALLDLIANYDKAIIVDAVDMRLAPGTIKQFSPQDAKINITHDALSTHGFGLAEVISFMEELEMKTELTIIGVQPEDITFGEGLTEKVQPALGEVLNIIVDQIS
ncbi:MAG: hydrogenase maturation protease [Gammaproteobacteria bacterium]|nr:hydrogenase maturation protease [Gammaproteobacteria bacterium]